jgi:hypothetical protein
VEGSNCAPGGGKRKKERKGEMKKMKGKKRRKMCYSMKTSFFPPFPSFHSFPHYLPFPSFPLTKQTASPPPLARENWHASPGCGAHAEHAAAQLLVLVLDENRAQVGRCGQSDTATFADEIEKRLELGDASGTVRGENAHDIVSECGPLRHLWKEGKGRGKQRKKKKKMKTGKKRGESVRMKKSSKEKVEWHKKSKRSTSIMHLLVFPLPVPPQVFRISITLCQIPEWEKTKISLRKKAQRGNLCRSNPF